MTTLIAPSNKHWSDYNNGFRPDGAAGGRHSGLDYGWGSGDAIYAALAGTVASAGYNNGWGYRIVLEHGNGIQTTYNHMWADTMYVSAGQTVAAGQHIADMGSTGDSTAKHLHFELYLSGSRVDPLPYYSQDLPGTSTPPAGAERRWNSDSGKINLRSGPGTSYPIVGEIVGLDYGDFNKFTHGESINGNTVWLGGAYNPVWASATGFTNTGPGNLPEVPNGTPEPPPVDPRPEYKPRDVFTIVEPGPANFPAWIRFEQVFDPDEVRDPLTKNYEDWQYYWDQYEQDKPYWFDESQVHWWNSPGAGDTHDSVVDYLALAVDKSADFVTSPGRITKMGSLLTASYTTGRYSMHAWTSENDPNITVASNPQAELGYKTLGFLQYIVEHLNPSIKGQPIRLHKDYMPTACSDIDTARVRRMADEFHSGKRSVETGELVKPPVPPIPVGTPWYILLLGNLATALITAVADWDKEQGTPEKEKE